MSGVQMQLVGGPKCGDVVPFYGDRHKVPRAAIVAKGKPKHLIVDVYERRRLDAGGRWVYLHLGVEVLGGKV